MNLTGVCVALLLALGVPAQAQVMSGEGSAIDGMTIDLAGTTIRLYGIATPALAQ